MAGTRDRCATQRASVMQRFLARVFRFRRNNRVHPITTPQEVVGAATLDKNVEVENRVIMEGYLFKRASNVFKTWNRCWFIIQNNQLVYKKKFKRNPTVVIEDLRLCTVKQCEDKRRHFCFQVVSPTKTYKLQADLEERRQAWITALRNISANTDYQKYESEMLDRIVSSSSKTLDHVTKLSDQVLDLSDQYKQLRSSSESRISRDSQTGYEASEEPTTSATSSNPNHTAGVDRRSTETHSVQGTCSAAEEEPTTSATSSNPNHTAGVDRRSTETHSVQGTCSAAEESFESRYTVGTLLGQGGCAAVYAGVCKADGKQVAFKYVRKETALGFITIPGETDSLPVEVALMQMVCKPPRCRHVLELLEWFETPEHYLLILERPVPCMDLFDYRQGDSLPEPVAKIIMWQVVLAARHCRDRGVLHRDIKEENLLINPQTLEVKLIDFGCGDLLSFTPYRKYLGTTEYCPPEWVREGKYCACPATVWSLGVLLFLLVCGEVPFSSRKEIVKGRLSFTPDVSYSCCQLIRSCLAKKPQNRPSLEMILQHSWF